MVPKRKTVDGRLGVRKKSHVDEAGHRPESGGAADRPRTLRGTQDGAQSDDGYLPVAQVSCLVEERPRTDLAPRCEASPRQLAIPHEHRRMPICVILLRMVKVFAVFRAGNLGPASDEGNVVNAAAFKKQLV